MQIAVNVQIVAAMQNKRCCVDNSIYAVNSFCHTKAINAYDSRWCANSSGLSDNRGRAYIGCCKCSDNTSCAESSGSKIAGVVQFAALCL